MLEINNFMRHAYGCCKSLLYSSNALYLFPEFVLNELHFAITDVG